MSKSELSNINEHHLDGDVFFLHPAQETVYFDQQLHPDNPMYNIGGYQVIENAYDLKTMRQAWHYLYEKVDALRYSLTSSDDHLPRQYILDSSSDRVAVEYYDFSESLSPHDCAVHWVREQFDTPMDVINGERHQVALLKVEEKRYYLVLRFHHLFIDGLGVYRLFERFHQVYDCLRHDKSLLWLDYLPQYREQVSNMREFLDSSRYQRSKEYWQRLLDSNEVTRLPRYYQEAGSGESRCELAACLSRHLEHYCEDQGISLLALLTGVVSIYFGRTLGKEDVVLGTAVHGRTNKKSQQVIGMFSNIIPMVCNILPGERFNDYARQVAGQLTKSFRHSRFPASHIARLSDNEGGHLSDIHVLYEKFENSPQGSNVPHGAVPIPDTDHSMDIISISSRYDIQPLQIRLIDFQSNHKLALRVNYLNQCFDHQEIAQFISRVINMLKVVVADENVRVEDIPLLLNSDIEFELNKQPLVTGALHQYYCLHQLVECHAKATPMNTALIVEGERLSYDELNKKANQLARRIRDTYQAAGEPLSPDTLIGLCIERSIDMVVSILAVLKAGGAYLPIDPKAPVERTQFMLEDARTALVLTQRSQFGRLDGIISSLNHPPLLIAVDDVTGCEFSDDNLSSKVNSSHLAYVIYTSGTSGQPKGVLQTHQNAMRLFEATRNDYQFNADDVWVLYHAYTFDFSVWELWGALLNGGALFIPTADMVRDLPAFIEACAQYQVSVLNQTPAAFYSFAGQVTRSSLLWPQLRYVIFGGDKLNLAQLVPWWRQYGDKHPQLVNMYGITETTVHVTYKPLRLSDVHGVSHIGRPLLDMRCYVLDDNLQPVPPGTPGELYVGGAGVARGYLNRPALTAERFVENPYATGQERRLGYDRIYKSGDLVRRLSDGNLAYLGRNDFQVKIRGYRIELGEVEAALVALPEITQAVVIDRERDGHKYLAAYLVFEPSCLQNAVELQDTLATVLPDYMIPATFSVIDAIPLTQNGKLDRQRLPEPEFIDKGSYLAPRSMLEDQLCRIFQQVLGIEKIGIRDNFFHIGGDSIIAIELVSVIRREGLRVTTKDIFDAPTIAQLAVRICRSDVEREVITEQGELVGEFGLLPIQQQFFDKSLARPHHWNQAFIVDIPTAIEGTVLAQVIERLIAQHDVLRCRFNQGTDGTYRQVFLSVSEVAVTPFKLDTSSLSDDELEDKLTSIQSKLNYSTGPLWQVAHLTGYSDGVNRLWFAFHHLIIDAVSWRILVDDIRYMLSGGQLGDKTSSYRQWVAEIADYATCHKDEVNYWQSVLDDLVVRTASNELNQYRLSLSEGMTASLLRESNSGYKTEINDLLLSALAIALNHIFNTPVCHIVLEAHGREGADTSFDVSRTVGWFTTLYPVRLKDKGDIGATIIGIKQMLRAIPNKGVGYGALWQSGKDLGGPLPDISFNYFGQFNNRQSDTGNAGWTIRSEGCGQTIAKLNCKPALLDINSVISDGVLEFRIESGLADGQGEIFVQALEKALIDVIEHAKSVDAPIPVIDEANTRLSEGYKLPGNRQWYFQRTKELECWGPCALFEFSGNENYSQQIQQVVEAVVNHHQGLRINIIDDGDNRLERVRPSARFECFDYLDCAAMSEEEFESVLAQCRHGLDFSQSLLRFLYCDRGADRQDQLYVVIHHLTMDRYSLGIFFRDLITTLERITQGQAPALGRAGSSFGDWVEESSRWLSSNEASDSLQFWQAKLEQQVVPLPTDYPFSHQANNIGTRRELEYVLSREASRRLKKRAASYELNEYFFAITAITKGLSEWCNGGQVCFEEVLVGREHFDNLDLSDTVGWLNDYLPIFVTPDPAKTGVEFVQSVREQVMACKQFGKGFSELKYNRDTQSEGSIAGLIQPEIDINFIPETLSIDQGVLDHRLIKLVRYDEMIGQEREAMHKLSCTVSFAEEKLVFTWEYGELIYNSATVEKLAASCAEHLLALVASSCT